MRSGGCSTRERTQRPARHDGNGIIFIASVTLPGWRTEPALPSRGENRGFTVGPGPPACGSVCLYSFLLFLGAELVVL